MTAREQKAVRLFRDDARTIDDICAALDLTRRTVERAIREALKAWVQAARLEVADWPEWKRNVPVTETRSKAAIKRGEPRGKRA